MRLKARWVFPVVQPPIENGIVEIDGEHLSAVRPAGSHEVATDLGDVAILPGLVNAHTHLEFSLLRQPLEPPLPFTDWIRNLVAYRRTTFAADAQAKLAALRAGWQESARAGTTLVGDIATDAWSDEAFSGLGPRVVGFRELIGLRPDAVAVQHSVARRWLELKDSQLRGLSPHAPYTVAPELLQQVVQLAKQHDATIAMHVAETRAELELLRAGTGEFADMLRDFGAWPEGGLPTPRRSLDILRELADAPRALVVHGNYLLDDEIDFLANRPNLTVVFCPRTHAFFQHEPYPLRTMLNRGVRVAIGTDGRGSNPDLSVWNELLFVRQHFPDIAPSRLLELGTLAGARALGFDNCGHLSVGQRADLAIVMLPSGSDADPHERLLSPDTHVVETVIAARTVQGRI